MSKKRGFTLVEVLVVIAITTLVFALVGGAMVFLTKSSGDLIHKSEAIIQAQTIEKHLRSFVDESNNIKGLTVGNNNKCSIESVVFEDSNNTLKIYGTEYEGIANFTLLKTEGNGDDSFVRCTFTIFNNNQSTEYTFILGIYTEQ